MLFEARTKPIVMLRCIVWPLDTIYSLTDGAKLHLKIYMNLLKHLLVQEMSFKIKSGLWDLILATLMAHSNMQSLKYFNSIEFRNLYT